MPTKTAQSARSKRTRGDWLKLVAQVIDQTRAWAERSNWSTHTDTKTVQESLLGEYEVPVLRIKTPQGEVYVEPIGRDIIGADGRIDLIAWPSHFRVKLIRRKDTWHIVTDSNITLRRPWSQKTFTELAKELVT